MITVDRMLVGGVTPPPRIVHLGLGAFHKSHQAAFTWAASDREDWGIVGFAGRSGPDVALNRQGGVFTVVSTDGGSATAEVVGSIAESRGASTADFVASVSSASTAIVSLTVTESAWGLTTERMPRETPELRRDADAVRTGDLGEVRTMWGRLFAALDARRRAHLPRIAVLPCDNISANGEALRRGLSAFGDLVGSGSGEFLDDAASFVSSSVDRITPRTLPEQRRRLARAAGYADECAVIAEPYSAWVIAGEFPQGRPDWASAGAEFVADVAMHDLRKLTLLNGAHLVLAAYGLTLGCESTDEAFARGEVRERVEAYWAEAAAALPGVDVAPYLRDLRRRLTGEGGAYPLRQIADGWRDKVQVRLRPVQEAAARSGARAPETMRVIELLSTLSASAGERG